MIEFEDSRSSKTIIVDGSKKKKITKECSRSAVILKRRYQGKSKIFKAIV